MKKTLLVLLSALLISSCGANRGDNYKDPEITTVVLEVTNDLEKRGVDTSRVFNKVDSWDFDDSLPSNVNGICVHGSKDIIWNLSQTDTGNHVHINRYHWDRMTSFERKSLISHEVVGHCTWEKAHTERGVMRETLFAAVTQNGYENLMDNFASTLK